MVGDQKSYSQCPVLQLLQRRLGQLSDAAIWIYRMLFIDSRSDCCRFVRIDKIVDVLLPSVSKNGGTDDNHDNSCKSQFPEPIRWAKASHLLGFALAALRQNSRLAMSSVYEAQGRA